MRRPLIPALDPMLRDALDAHRVYVVLGPYGSGKTEFAVNLAILLSRLGRRSAICDLDIVNPYFRSREREELLKAEGVELMAPPRHISAADLPTIPGGLFRVFGDKGMSGVLDVGGDPAGAKLLASFAEDMRRAEPFVLYVVNRARLGPVVPQEAMGQLRQIEASGQVRVDALVNNTHLLHETTPDIVKEGAAFAGELAALTGLPVFCHAVKRDMIGELDGLKPLFPIDIHMKRPWE